MARCHSYLFFTLIEQTYNILYILLVEHHSCPHCFPLGRGPPLGCRDEIRTRACRKASRRATIWATPHPDPDPKGINQWEKRWVESGIILFLKQIDADPYLVRGLNLLSEPCWDKTLFTSKMFWEWTLFPYNVFFWEKFFYKIMFLNTILIKLSCQRFFY